jgi:hypothetical protein
VGNVSVFGGNPTLLTPLLVLKLLGLKPRPLGLKLAANYKPTHSLHGVVLFEKLVDAYPVNELSEFLGTLYIVDLGIACHGAQVSIATGLWAVRSGVTIPVGAR